MYLFNYLYNFKIIYDATDSTTGLTIDTGTTLFSGSLLDSVFKTMLEIQMNS